ncbi:MAG: cyclase [Chlorobi bacterium]|nr:cyclase [Chlorobiota bacterium]
MTQSEQIVPNQEEMRQLQQREILVDLAFLPEDVIGVSGRICITAPPEAVWAALTDYDNLCKTLPKVVFSKLIERNGNEIILDQTGKTGIFFFEKTVNFRLKVRETYLKRIDFEQLSGDFRVYRGAWILSTCAEENRTLLHYEAELKPSFFAPPILVSFVQRLDLPGILNAHKKKAETIAGRHSLERGCTTEP